MILYALTPLEVFHKDNGLTDLEIRILCVLLSFRGKNTNVIWPTRAVIAERSGYAVGTISNVLKRLEQKGWLVRQKRVGASRFEIVIPDVGVHRSGEDPVHRSSENHRISDYHQFSEEHSHQISEVHSHRTGEDHSHRSSEMELTKELTNDLTKGTNQGTADAKAPPPRAHRQPGQRTEKPADPELVLPANLNPEAWSLFDQHRNSTAKLRASWTPVAKSRAIAQLVTLSPEDQMRVVDYSITGGYPGLYLDRLQSRTPRTPDKPKGAIARALEALDAADRAAAAGSDPNWPGSYAGQTPRLCSGRGGNTAGD